MATVHSLKLGIELTKEMLKLSRFVASYRYSHVMSGEALYSGLCAQNENDLKAQVLSLYTSPYVKDPECMYENGEWTELGNELKALYERSEI